jgi:dienelactone hydrolase
MMNTFRGLILTSALGFLVAGAANRVGAAPAPYFFEEPTEQNVIYGMDYGTALLMDVYRPAHPNGYGIIFIMGTGFTASGEYDDIPLKNLDRSLVDRGVFPPIFGGTGHFFGPELHSGFTIFTINHRLAPVYNWKVQVRDCQRAVQFVRHNAATYGISPAAIGGMGHSSGATMITFLATMGDVADPASVDPVNRESSRIQAAVAASGVHDTLTFRDQSPLAAAVLVGLIGHPILFESPDQPVFAAYRDASTISHVSKNTAPMLLFHGDADPVVDYHQSIELDKALAAAGVDHQLVLIPGAVHGNLTKPFSPTPAERANVWLLDQLSKVPKG